jgi:hypothetical protein
VPVRQYGTGYAVSVQGGAVTSKGRADLLRLVTCAGVDRVTVKVQPGSGVTSSCAAASKGARKTQLRVTLSPRKVMAGSLVTVRATVRAKGRAVRGAVVRIGRQRARTDARGRAQIKVRCTRAALRSVVASATGYRSGRARLAVRR